MSMEFSNGGGALAAPVFSAATTSVFGHPRLSRWAVRNTGCASGTGS
jgi:hypothetical protein